MKERNNPVHQRQEIAPCAANNRVWLRNIYMYTSQFQPFLVIKLIFLSLTQMINL